VLETHIIEPFAVTRIVMEVLKDMVSFQSRQGVSEWRIWFVYECGEEVLREDRDFVYYSPRL
jgi:hypothetical protein